MELSVHKNLDDLDKDTYSKQYRVGNPVMLYSCRSSIWWGLSTSIPAKICKHRREQYKQRSHVSLSTRSKAYLCLQCLYLYPLQTLSKGANTGHCTKIYQYYNAYAAWSTAYIPDTSKRYSTICREKKIKYAQVILTNKRKAHTSMLIR